MDIKFITCIYELHILLYIMSKLCSQGLRMDHSIQQPSSSENLKPLQSCHIFEFDLPSPRES